MPLRLGGHILKRIEEERTTGREFETTDWGLAVFLYYRCIPLVTVTSNSPQVFVFKSPNPRLIRMWQMGKIAVHGPAYWQAYQSLKLRVWEHSTS